MGIAEVRATAGISGNSSTITESLNRINQSLDQQLIAAIQQTRKFDLSARSDLDRLIEESAATGGGFVIQQLDYLLVVTVDDFQDHTEKATFSNLGQTVEKRVIRLSAIAKIYDTETGSILESISIGVENFDAKTQKAAETERGGKLSDSLITALSRDMAAKIAAGVTDIIFPAKVLAITGPQVTFNRGRETGVKIGEMWKVYAVGETLVDPDTGEVLGAEEVEIGSIRITAVLPKFSKGTVIDNFGIEQGQILRPQL